MGTHANGYCLSQHSGTGPWGMPTSVIQQKGFPKDDFLHIFRGIPKRITEVVGETPSDPTTLFWNPSLLVESKTRAPLEYKPHQERLPKKEKRSDLFLFWGQALLLASPKKTPKQSKPARMRCTSRGGRLYIPHLKTPCVNDPELCC